MARDTDRHWFRRDGNALDRMYFASAGMKLRRVGNNTPLRSCSLYVVNPAVVPVEHRVLANQAVRRITVSHVVHEPGRT